MDTVTTVTMQAAHSITAGQAVRTTGSRTVTPAVQSTSEGGTVHTLPFFGVALQTVGVGNKVDVQIGGVLSGLGSEKPGAVGVNSAGKLVRAKDKACISAPNWIGDCDASGTVTIRPRRDTRLNVLDFGAAGDGKVDDTDALQAALDCATRFEAGEPVLEGKLVYLPPGDYLIRKPLVVKHHCILEGAGGTGLGVTENTRILADVKAGNFDLSAIGPVAGETVYCAIALVGAWTSGSAVVPSRARADYAVLRQFTLESFPDQGIFAPAFYQAPQMDGVRILAHGPLIETVGVSGFRRNGLSVDGPLGQANANLTQIRDCVLDNNGQHGLDIGSHGNSDANTMLIMNVSASTNGRDGINDHSFLGCTFVSCHTASNHHRNYSCDNVAPNFATYIGCYGEGDAPSVFNGNDNIAVIGGDIAITPDSKYWGFAPASSGPSSLRVTNHYSEVHLYPGTGAGLGIHIDKGELQTPGNGFKYRAIRAGRTYGEHRSPVESPPKRWPEKVGETVEEFEGLIWSCEGKYERPVSAFNYLGSYVDSMIIQDYGYDKPDIADQNPFFRTQVSSTTEVKGRIETSLTSGTDRHTYYQNSYENGPVPGTLLLPDAWIGDYYFGERRIGVVYNESPFKVPHSDRSVDFYSPGDLLLNATGRPTEERQGGVGWAVKALCGRRPKADGSDWVPNQHYRIGEVVRPAQPNGRGHLYRLTAYIGGPTYPLQKVSGEHEPDWSKSVGGVTSDNHLKWQTLYDLDVPANAWVIEPLPQRAKGQPDSAATDIAGLREEFNALLAKMRKANLLE
ncbi:glycosyl hydrolase family 28-related protein [Streptomyces hokutonensis]|uniref:glycosyl hydrolase family 28-related protein n=1 Tax=Streptomyces hokutonensis TaxID=1306990 RepID=UPI003820CF11